MTVHFAYAVPPLRYRSTGIWAKPRRLAEKAGMRLGVEPSYRRGLSEVHVRPLRAPFSITCHLSRFLSQRIPTLVYDWGERVCPPVEPDDIVLGHPHSDPATVIQRVFRSEVKCRAKALIFPIHHGIPSISTFVVPLVERAAVVFGIMGQFWHETIGNSHYAVGKEKIVRVDMAVDAEEYPLVKTSFNPPGQRGYLYIGANRPEKGIEVMSRTMSRMQGFPRGWIGRGEEIPGMQRLAEHVDLTPEFVRGLAQRYDFFVNTSVSDANPTTILEAMAWGFPVACTPESGYHKMPTIMTLSTSDIEGNVRALLELQHAPEERLREIGAANRRLVEEHYTWERFCSTVWAGLEPYLEASAAGHESGCPQHGC